MPDTENRAHTYGEVIGPSRKTITATELNQCKF